MFNSQWLLHNYNFHRFCSSFWHSHAWKWHHKCEEGGILSNVWPLCQRCLWPVSVIILTSWWFQTRENVTDAPLFSVRWPLTHHIKGKNGESMVSKKSTFQIDHIVHRWRFIISVYYEMWFHIDSSNRTLCSSRFLLSFN